MPRPLDPASSRRPQLRSWRRLGLGLLGASLALLAIGCTRPPEMTLPDEFVSLEEPGRDYEERRTNAHGVIVAVRTIDNEVEGSLAFWVETIREGLRTQGGYALLEDAPFEAASGETGHQLRFGRDRDSQPHLYWLTIFVRDDRIYLIEAGGRQERFEEAQPQIEAMLASTRLP